LYKKVSCNFQSYSCPPNTTRPIRFKISYSWVWLNFFQLSHGKWVDGIEVWSVMGYPRWYCIYILTLFFLNLTLAYISKSNSFFIHCKSEENVCIKKFRVIFNHIVYKQEIFKVVLHLLKYPHKKALKYKLMVILIVLILYLNCFMIFICQLCNTVDYNSIFHC
jgi:hypothetical protein